MKDKLDQFVANLNGQFVEVSSREALYQCMDLAYLWVFALGFPKATIQNQYAHQAYTSPKEITYEYFDIIPNTPSGIPQDGDIVVWKKTTGNIAGHIAVALGGGTTSKFRCFEQNSPLGTNAHISEKTYSNVLGWLRPKNVDGTETEPTWFKNLLVESGMSLDREGEFRAFWDKAKRYDDEIHALQEQVKSANESLSSRAGEVSILIEKNQKLSSEKDELQEQVNRFRSERDKETWEREKIQIQNKSLVEEVDSLKEKLGRLETENSLYAYTKWERLISLFFRG